MKESKFPLHLFVERTIVNHKRLCMKFMYRTHLETDIEASFVFRRTCV